MVDATDESAECPSRPPRSAVPADPVSFNDTVADATLLREQRDILQAIATDEPAADVLVRLCHSIEARVTGALCSVLLRDPGGHCVRNVAAPSLPPGYIAAVDGQPIGPEAGSSGTAMHRNALVIVPDIATDRLWHDARALALAHGLRACTSLPLHARNGKVLGAFALYWRQPTRPRPADIELLRAAGHLASIALEREADILELRRREQQFRSLFANHPDAVFQFDPDGRFVDVNESALTLVGYTREEVLGRHWRTMTDPDEHARAQRRFERALAGEHQRYEVRVRHRDGHVLFMDVTNQPVREGARTVGVFGIARDITGRKRGEQQLLLLRRAVEASANGICIADARRADMPLTYVNPAFERITGYSAHEVLGRNGRLLQGAEPSARALEIMRNALAEGREVNVVLRNQRRDGSQFWNELHLSPIVDDAGNVTHWLGIQNDITERKQYEDNLRHHASHDALTGLPNRTLLEDRIAQTCQFAARHGHRFAVLFIDLDGFKPINDSYGHHCGDLVLCEVAARILASVKPGDTVARLGGDEFVVVLTEVADAEAVVAMAEPLLARLAEPYEGCRSSAGVSLHLTASVGLALWEGADIPPMQLVQQADLAMFKAKQAGRNTWAWYSGSLDHRLGERLQLRRELQVALAGDQFHLVYQPQISADGRSVVAIEALLRWQHPELGAVSPGEFIPVAEETGQIVSLGAWVLETACRQAAEWRRAGHDWVMSVNVSALQFRRPGFVAGRPCSRSTACRPRRLSSRSPNRSCCRTASKPCV